MAAPKKKVPSDQKPRGGQKRKNDERDDEIAALRQEISERDKADAAREETREKPTGSSRKARQLVRWDGMRCFEYFLDSCFVFSLLHFITAGVKLGNVHRWTDCPTALHSY